MIPPMDPSRIEAALSLLEQCAPGDRILALKNLCENNGVWTIPEDHSRYSPVLYEISLFGVPAISDDIERLPDNWKRAAGRILEGLSEERSSSPTRHSSSPSSSRHTAAEGTLA